MPDRKRVLFLCTGNSCRSQMAEGLARYRWNDQFDVVSAGIEKHGLNPLAVRAMQEIGIDISKQLSQSIDEFPEPLADYVITVCGHADETCPALPGPVERLHVGFDDPPKLAADAKSDEEALPHYRRVRDEIAAFVAELPARLGARKRQ